MTQASLKARIRRLETLELDAKAVPFLITGVTHFSSQDEIVAVIGLRDNATIFRQPNEPLDTFTVRAGKELHEKHLLAIYEKDAFLKGFPIQNIDHS
jgi:hypothetical protein